MKKNLFILLPFLIFYFANAQQKGIGKIQISFENVVGDKILQLDSIYTNNYEEPFSITQFKYYISNISLLDINGKKTSLGSNYFLIDHKQTESKTCLLHIPQGEYKAISFTIGVDSVKNISGVQTGALDPANGMFWTWNTGYIMAKLEGTSPLSNVPMHRINYHIGGFKQPNNSIKTIELTLPSPIQIKSNATSTVNIEADILKWFNGKNEIKISDLPFCMNPGVEADKIAENYANMFRIVNVIVP